MIKKLIEKFSPDPEAEAREREQRIRIAACVILLEVAKSDYEFSTIERDVIEAILEEEFGVPEEAVNELLEMAERERRENVDLYEFTKLIKQSLTREERNRLIEFAWEIVYADEKLDKFEDHLVHRLTILLGLDHHELIEAKMRVLHRDDS